MKTILTFSIFIFFNLSYAQEILSAKNDESTSEGLSSPQNSILEGQQKVYCAFIGSVIDQSSREPIAKAKVSLLGTKISVYTSNDGQYKIDSVAVGIYQIKAEADGYEPQIMNNVYFDQQKKATGFFTLQKMQQEPPDFVAVEHQPQPISGHTPAPKYPEIAHRAGIEGTVWVKIWIDEEGNARKAVLLKSDAEILNQTSLDTAMKWKFKPAVLNGKPVAVWVSIPFKFKMNKAEIKKLKTK
jgi:TonB family protein